MKCQACAATGRDVIMEDLGGGQHQCPDCRATVVPVAQKSTTTESPAGAATPSAVGPAHRGPGHQVGAMATPEATKAAEEQK